MRPVLKAVVPRAVATTAVGFLLAVSALSPAFAADGDIDHVEATEDGLRVLFSVPGIGQGAVPDLDTVRATLDGQEMETTAGLAADSAQGVRRTAVLAIDVSRSMQGPRFDEAKAAARAFLETVPLDVFVGVVTFAGDVVVVQEPTLNHAAAADLLDGLDLSLQTRLNDGIQAAVRAAGAEGQRSVLVLSDGADTSDTPLTEVTSTIRDAEVKVDVVALAQSKSAGDQLGVIARAGKGTVIETGDPRALSDLFEREAAALAKQVLVTAAVPAGFVATEGTLAIELTAAGEAFTDSAYVAVQPKAEDLTKAVFADPKAAVVATRTLVSPTVMLVGLAALGVGSLAVLLALLGVTSPRGSPSVTDHIAAYTRAGARVARTSGGGAGPGARSTTAGLAGSARAAAEKALASDRGREAKLATKLDAAGMSVKPAEWLLTQVAVAFGSALLGMLFGSLFLAVLFLALGVVIPNLYLRFKQSQRIKAFNNQLADTLQLMAGSLSAGLSLAQSADTVVREGSEPMTGEFKRALIEARLGVSIEDTFESIARRMQSNDFEWVVMAVRIQREVGGNLAEVLTQVAATIRERAYLRRQVKSLSAEGVLSAWILGGLPVAVMAFLIITRPEYLAPMVTTGMGLILSAMGVVLLVLGALWLRAIVHMEV